ncbi:PREDICTED: ejaculatory bulb-specific protein 3-like isoform X2 [Papilio polytes]|nr:PREDICTED: ejaculatory bulb-specific protein 3-like isoform X2 [Papilio polytes]XP_013137244.1 PREDICTED: ejaculatory bulb-specific protein 3-like isoform X2 [Papilio polytes]XP_013137245.1 PREDICTED: ejaculatory bulb-specific protein 3-like isoform X2 [Papilio polytes]
MVFLSLILALLIPTALSYDAAYDRVDANKVLADDTLFRSYIDCFLDRKPCTAEFSEEFKKILPEVIKEACAKCSEPQKKNVRKIVKALYEKYPDDAIQFTEKYDPKREYETAFAAFVAEE